MNKKYLALVGLIFTFSSSTHADGFNDRRQDMRQDHRQDNRVERRVDNRMDRRWIIDTGENLRSIAPMRNGIVGNILSHQPLLLVFLSMS
ncbi:hypothetical protein [Photobacterium leiognathi]|uniref:hypothetical protein n=1 Tax=Photobacterium leiognathi TaxID=553611 RepID=UPI0029824E9C|nr:hypothetical protein [Photobacterium leiognathi]